MDILRIQGENIASLAKPFDIRFDEPPLSGAGLFAITGDTGSGKSSLLDALCLALFGKCPRLNRSGINDQVPDVTGEMLQSTDGRTILRRGASKGYARVQFRANDGDIYEASWSVRRARDKNTGRLQAVERSVTRLSDGVVLENQTRATDSKVEALCGLTYEEFGRSVLLAQGDFDSFLSATTAERAIILEKITDASLYRDISKRAFEAHRAAKDAVTVLETRLGEHKILDEADKTALEEKAAALTNASKESERQKSNLKDELARYTALDDAQKQIEVAKTELQQATEAWEAAQDDVDLLSQLQKAAGLRAEWQEKQKAKTSLDLVHSELEKIKTTHKEAEQAELEAHKRALEKTEQADALEAEFKRLGPQWDEAAKLDAQIDSAKTEVEKAKTSLTESQSALTEKQQILSAAEASFKQVSTARTALQAKINAEPAAQVLTSQWAILEDRLQERIKACIKRSEAESQKETGLKKLAAQSGRKLEISKTLSQSQEKIAKAEETITRNAPRRKKLTEEAPAARIERLNISLSSVQRMKGLAQRFHATKLDITRLADQIASQQKSILDNESQIKTAQQEEANATCVIQALRSSTQLAEAAVSQEATRLRNQLIDDEPCPVCGSKDHPVHATEEAAKLAKELRSQLTAAETKRQAALDAATKARSSIDAATLNITASNEKMEMQKSILDECEAVFAKCFASEADGPIADRLPVSPSAEETTFISLLEQLDKWQAQLTADYHELAKLDDAYKAAQQAIEQEKSIITTLTKEFDQLTQQTAPTEQKQALLTETIKSQHNRIMSLDTELTREFSQVSENWSMFGETGQVALAALSHRKETLLSTIEELELAKEQETKATRECEKTKLALDGAKTDEAKAQATLADRNTALKDLQSSRASLLGGASTGAHRTAFNKKRTNAHRAATEAQKAHGEQKTALAGLSAQIKSKTDELHKARLRMSEAAEILTAVIEQSGLELSKINSLLNWQPEAIADLSDRLKALQLAQSKAQAQLNTRQQDHQILLAKGLPALPREALREQIKTIDEQDTERQTLLADIRVKLELDRQAHEKQAEIVSEIEASKAVLATWAAINDVIGAANGNKFAEIAQSVTLGLLVDHANHHLSDIKPRYRLVLGDGKLSLHVVDDHMAGEIRSTRSLSGGERFLVSLSLALALSTIGGRGSFASMLFIDEGFGTLDSDSLEMAINALEALQAQGRTIGVISHVQAMKDRIPVQIQIKPQGGGASEIQLMVE